MLRASQRLSATGWLGALALCLLHAWLAMAGQSRVGATYDEPIHITSGRVYWQAGDFRFQPENGNLPQRWQALPLLGPEWSFPTAAEMPEVWINANPWLLSRTWFFERGQSPDAILGRARLMNSLVGATLCAVIFLWSLSLFGPLGGLLSLGLAVFSPNLLAHAGLATSDTSAALGAALAVLAWWRLFHRITPGRVLTAGLATGAFALAKYSAVLLAPALALLLLARLVRSAPLPYAFSSRARLLRGRGGRAAGLLSASCSAIVVAWVLVWAAYDFRAAASPRGPIADSAWDEVLLRQPVESGWNQETKVADAPVILRAGPIQHGLAILRFSGILPEAWVYGFAHVVRHSMARAAYLNGEYSSTGFTLFFPSAFALKTPEAGLLALALGLATLIKFRSSRLSYRILPVAVFVIIYGAFAVTSRLNIGYRHLLPLLPFLWIAAGATALALRSRRRLFSLVAGGLVGAQALASLTIAPHYLAYFNHISGGSAHGNRHLVDSSLDWGQGLPELDRWLSAHYHGEPLHLSYFGSDDPARYPWPFVRIADSHFDAHPRAKPAPMRGGLYCIGATQFRRVYSPVGGPWSPPKESRYRELTTWFGQEDINRDGSAPATLPADVVSRRLTELEHLRFARLCLWLEHHDPEALIAGGSLLLFRISDSELGAALDSNRPPH